MKYLDVSNFKLPIIKNYVIHIKIDPFIYLDGRKPRLPRKQSKKYKLQKDTNFFFAEILSSYNANLVNAKFQVKILIIKGNDSLGTGDLDNYSKAILDGITKSQKIWKDDSAVDYLLVKRTYSKKEKSTIKINIKKFNMHSK